VVRGRMAFPSAYGCGSGVRETTSNVVGQGGNNIGDLAARRRRRMWFGWATGAVVLVVAVVVVAVKPWTAEFRHGGLNIAEPPAPVRPVSKVAPAPDDAPAPSQNGIAEALAPVVGNPDLGGFSGSVTDAASGNVLWSSDASKPVTPSSTAKILTSAAALIALPDDKRVGTRVVAGAHPGEVVLIGGGDPTLTAQPDGEGYYPNGPRLADLADQLRASGIQADRIVVDNSAYTGPGMAKGWDPLDIEGGSIAPIEPVMLDGGRLEPLSEYSPRSDAPAEDVGRALATELGTDPAQVQVGEAAPNAAELASVHSAPLRDRLRDLMVHSDNVLAETVGREIAVATGKPASFDGAAEAVSTVLRDAGFDMAQAKMHDTSGLSVEDQLPARLLDSVLASAAAPDGADKEHPLPPKRPQLGAGSVRAPTTTNEAPEATDELPTTLAPILDYLPVAGGTGSLTSRFGEGAPVGAGWVRAKTGTLSVASTLAGYVLDNDGRVLTFALMSSDRPPEASRPALDSVAATLRNCGCS